MSAWERESPESPEESRSEPEQERGPHRPEKEDPEWSTWVEEERGGWGEEILGAGDPALLAGDPDMTFQQDGVALRCPRSDCDETDWAPDYHQAHWPTCQVHHVRMVLVDVRAG
jgi:hypothetical protein